MYVIPIELLQTGFQSKAGGKGLHSTREDTTKNISCTCTGLPEGFGVRYNASHYVEANGAVLQSSLPWLPELQRKSALVASDRMPAILKRKSQAPDPVRMLQNLEAIKV